MPRCLLCPRLQPPRPHYPPPPSAAAALQVFRQAFLQKGRQPAPQRSLLAGFPVRSASAAPARSGGGRAPARYSVRLRCLASYRTRGCGALGLARAARKPFSPPPDRPLSPPQRLCRFFARPFCKKADSPRRSAPSSPDFPCAARPPPRPFRRRARCILAAAPSSLFPRKHTPPFPGIHSASVSYNTLSIPGGGGLPCLNCFFPHSTCCWR